MRSQKNETKTETLLAYILGVFIIATVIYITLLATGVL